MKKTSMLMMVLLSLTLALTGCGNSGTDAADQNQAPQDSASQSGAPDSTTPEPENVPAAPAELHHIEIEIKDYGKISLELDASAAPATVQNFIALTQDGFYDGLTFHRIIPGFMIQGGDPRGDGTGGAEQTIQGEFAANGVENNLTHTRGTISMARSSQHDSASSQFFIVHEDSVFLDGQYAAFGHVTEGMEIVDKICEDAIVEDENGTVAPENQPVITSVKVID